MKMYDFILKDKEIEMAETYNYLNIPKTTVPMNDRGAKKFNEIYFALKKCIYAHKFERSKSGGVPLAVAQDGTLLYDVRAMRSCVELTVLNSPGNFRLQFRFVPDESKSNILLSGTAALYKFKRDCAKLGINLDDPNYAINSTIEAMSLRPTVERYIIDVPLAPEEYGENVIFTGVNHVDINSSFPAGLIEGYPEFAPVIQDYYDRRHGESGEYYKALLNESIGAFWSESNGMKWIKLARAAINNSNKNLKSLAKRLTDCGNRIILYNTDGIWYTGGDYHDSREGKEIGQWKTDHKNCTMRIKSKGTYEFLENGKYTPVQRGYTNLDKVKPRSEWEWGDIFRKENSIKIMYEFSEQNGITSNNGGIYGEY